MDTDRDSAAAMTGGAPVSTLPAPAPVRPRSRKAAPRPVPERAEAYAHLTLEAVRSYRTALTEEENKVSYWRRILQARLDVLRSGVGGGVRDVDQAALRSVLTDARVGAGRRALVDVVAVDDIPPLPQLEALWERRVAPDDVEGALELEKELAAAERQLSDYRAALHRRLADVTGELIARYREQPSLCLAVLPLPPERMRALAWRDPHHRSTHRPHAAMANRCVARRGPPTDDSTDPQWPARRRPCPASAEHAPRHAAAAGDAAGDDQG